MLAGGDGLLSQDASIAPSSSPKQFSEPSKLNCLFVLFHVFLFIYFSHFLHVDIYL